MTKDLQTVTVGALVTYSSTMSWRRLPKIADLPSDIMERSQGAILAEVSERRWRRSRPTASAFNAESDRKGRQRAERIWRVGPAGAADRVRALPGLCHQWARGGRQLRRSGPGSRPMHATADRRRGDRAESARDCARPIST